MSPIRFGMVLVAGGVYEWHRSNQADPVTGAIGVQVAYLLMVVGAAFIFASPAWSIIKVVDK